MPQRGVCDDERVAAFAEIAQCYCALIESDEDVSSRDFIKQCADALAQLYRGALSLIDVPLQLSDGHDVEGMSHEEWKTVFDRIGVRIGDHEYYMEVIDPYDMEASTGCGSLSDDLADMYRDLKPALCLYGRSEADSNESVFSWRLSFLSHWGRHCTSALRAIHCVLVQTEGMA